MTSHIIYRDQLDALSTQSCRTARAIFGSFFHLKKKVLGDVPRKKTYHSYLGRFFIFICLWMMVSSSFAALLVWPTRLQMETAENGTALWLENRGNKPKVIQVRVFSWDLVDGQPQLSEQKMVAASPPMAEIAPGDRQLIRLMKLTPVAAQKEQTFRVVVDEIPQVKNTEDAAEGDDQNSTGSSGINFQMRYSIPLFVYGEGLSSSAMEKQTLDNIKPTLSWRIIKENDAQWLEVQNDGLFHVHLNKISFPDVAQPQDDLQLSGYVLAGSKARWQIPANYALAKELRFFINKNEVTLKRK